jgi:hypothetical protein
MVSDLKWRMGFGWSAVLLFGGAIGLVVMTKGLPRWAGAVGIIIMGTFIVFQYKKWNTTGWRQIHFRAMLVYARCAGKESVRAKQAGEPFCRVNACRELGIAICSKNSVANVEAMVLALEEEKGNYLANLLEANAECILPKLSVNEVLKLADQLRRLEFCPELVVANVVENSFGSQEATRYAMAVLKREAH